MIMSFFGDSVVKNLPVNMGDLGSIPGLGRSPGEGNGLRNLMDRGAWRGLWGCKRELDMT